MAIAVHPWPRREGRESVLPSVGKMTRKQLQQRAARVKRFLVLPPKLQEGALCYAESILKSYGGERV